MDSIPKAMDLRGRFREIVSDPLNLLIERHPLAGAVEGNLVMLHNGHKVPLRGAGAYCGEFSDILVINRGVHEPLEEFVFQELLRRLPEAPLMLELGAYWGHYSMWLKSRRPLAQVVLVEAIQKSLNVGRANFVRNGYEGEFILAMVGAGQFEVDRFLADRGAEHLDILHSDIQGAEGEMIEGAAQALAGHKIDYLFVSTHNNVLHYQMVETLRGHGYRVEVSSDMKHETTSFDGIVFASSPLKEPVMAGYEPAGRLDIARMPPQAAVARLARMLDSGLANGG